MKFIKYIMIGILFTSAMPTFTFFSGFSGRQNVGAEELFNAIDNEDVKEVEKLLKNKRIDPNVERKGKTALLQAIALPDEETAKKIVTLLLDYNVDPNISDDSGMTPLVFARYVQKPQIVLILLQHGAMVTGHKLLRRESRKKECPYEKALRKLEKEFYVIPKEKEEWTLIEPEPTQEEEWEMLRSKL